MNEPAPAPSQRTRLLLLAAELPLVVGILMGWLGAWWRGKAFVLDGIPRGYGWFDYVNNAWMIVHRQQLGYNNFREPLHAWMLGTLGEAIGSYADSGTLIASAGVFLLCVGAGFFGRALAGPWTGALAAAAVPWTAHSADMAHWANYYGVAGCFAGACLGVGALAWRWPHPVLALITGILGGITWGIDPRSMAVAAGGVGLVLVGLTRGGSSWLTRALSLGLLGGGLYLGPWSHDHLWLTEVADPTWQHRVDFQKQVIERWISRKQDLSEVCAGYRHLDTMAVLQGPCGQRLMEFNLREVFPQHLQFGLWPTLGGVALCFLPARQGWRGVLAGFALLSGVVGAVVLARTMPMPDRYAATFVAIFVMAAPVGLGRLVHTLLPLRFAPWVAAVATAALGVATWQLDPAERNRDTQITKSPQRALEREARVAVEERLGPDDLYRDCTQMMVVTALLPRLTQPPPPVLRIEANDQCLEWIEAAPPAEGTRWVSIERSSMLPDTAGRRINDARIDLDGRLQADPGWTRELSMEKFDLWKQTGGS